MSRDVIAQIEKALLRATPGPWEASPDNFVPGPTAILTAWCHEGEDAGLVADWCDAADAHLIANAPVWLAELVERVKAGAEDVRAFSEALGFGDGRTEPAASLEELIDPLRDAMSAARDHYECPVVCELCGERLASTTCEKCHGSGCLPNPELAHLECDECAGVGKVHVGCAEVGYADLAERVKAAEARALPEPGSGCICEWYSEDRGGGYHETMQEYDPACPEHSQHVYNPRTGVWEFPNAAEATIARVRALAEEHPGTAWNSGLNLRQALRDALGGTPTDATGGASSADDERNRFSGEDTDEPTQPILRPTDQRYEPPADDHESGCCRG